MIVVGIMLIASSMAYAGVNPQNGDFYISYTDASLSGQGHEVELVRTYNSKSTHVGWFGYGWKHHPARSESREVSPGSLRSQKPGIS
jgi:hypothetical protein